MKPHIQYETIQHAYPKVMKTSLNLMSHQKRAFALAHSASCDLILDGDKLISQEKASTKINAPTSLRDAFSALRPSESHRICPLALDIPYGKELSSLSKEQVEALKKDAEQKANGYKNSISTFHTSTTFKIDGSVKFQLLLVEYEFLNCYKEDHDGNRHCEEWFYAFHEGFNTKSIKERACTISYRIAGPRSQFEEEHLLFEFCVRDARDSWDSWPREYDTYFSIAELCLLHEKLQLAHASPIELMDLLFLIAEPRVI